MMTEIGKWRQAMKSTISAAAIVVFAMSFAAGVLTVVQPVVAASVKSFPSPEAAVSALMDAARKDGAQGLLDLFGEENEDWISSGDPVQDNADLERFIDAYDASKSIENEGADKAILVVGKDKFPFPIPLIKTAAGWAFSAEQGQDEILSRRIGRNELNTVEVLLAVVDAQQDYASVDRNADGLLEYAARIRSSEGKQDGLYWPTGENEPLSPLGPLIAEARQAGYGKAEDSDTADRQEPRPYHGYYFKILTGQGDAAPGGAREYVVGGRMIGGFGALAYPATYGNSGIMSFIVSHDGVIYDADLGPDTAELAGQIELFDPAEGWQKVDLKSRAR